MKFLPLVWSMLWRSRARTWLTFASIVVAFFLFGMLESVVMIFGGGHGFGAANTLVVSARQGFALPLPIAYRSRIEAIDGVTAITPVGIFGNAWYQERKNSANMAAADPAYLGSDPRFIIPPEQLKVWQATRSGVAVGTALARQHGWKLGDRIPIQTEVVKRDGSSVWEFEIAAIWEFNPQLMKGLEARQTFANYDYLDEARAFDKGSVFFYFVRIKDPALIDPVSAAIDAQFRNSSAETKTTTENQYYLDQAAQFGDVGLIVHSILSAVFFALALVAGNTMMQAFRERTGELAVLKTLGFSDIQVTALVVGESLLLAVGAGIAGLGLADLIVPMLVGNLGAGITDFTLDPKTLATGLGLAVLLGLAAALIPAWRAQRLTVVAALARH